MSRMDTGEHIGTKRIAYVKDEKKRIASLMKAAKRQDAKVFPSQIQIYNLCCLYPKAYQLKLSVFLSFSTESQHLMTYDGSTNRQVASQKWHDNRILQIAIWCYSYMSNLPQQTIFSVLTFCRTYLNNHPLLYLLL